MKIKANFRMKGGHMMEAESDDLNTDGAIEQIKKVVKEFGVAWNLEGDYLTINITK